MSNKTRIQIVDEDDNVIDHLEYDKVDYATQIYRVTGLWLTNSKGEILLAQRSLLKDNDPGVWGPAAAGTMDEGETYEENAYKEAEEEIGLKGVKFELGPKSKREGRRTYFAQWFTAVVDLAEGDFVLQTEEVEAVKWISPQDLVNDFTTRPEKYIPGMDVSIEYFIEPQAD